MTTASDEIRALALPVMTRQCHEVKTLLFIITPIPSTPLPSLRLPPAPSPHAIPRSPVSPPFPSFFLILSSSLLFNLILPTAPLVFYLNLHFLC